MQSVPNVSKGKLTAKGQKRHHEEDVFEESMITNTEDLGAKAAAGVEGAEAVEAVKAVEAAEAVEGAEAADVAATDVVEAVKKEVVKDAADAEENAVISDFKSLLEKAKLEMLEKEKGNGGD